MFLYIDGTLGIFNIEQMIWGELQFDSMPINKIFRNPAGLNQGVIAQFNPLTSKLLYFTHKELKEFRPNPYV